MVEAMRRLQACVDDAFAGKTALKVLEAGCGSCAHVRFGPAAYVVGIDVSARQLARNTHLSESVLGDVQHYNGWGESTFDAVVCWTVLEHLPSPELALARFVKVTRKGGLIILALPNVLSLKGLITKFTPLGFHVWAYRHVFDHRDAGLDDRGPFKTFLPFSLRPRALRGFADRNDLAVKLFEIYGRGESLHDRSRLAYGLYSFLETLARVVSLGTLGDSEIILVLQK